jgi:hypothetical protein
MRQNTKMTQFHHPQILNITKMEKIIMTDEYIFDPLGNVLKTTKTSYAVSPQQKVITEYLYEWDLWGNWTKQVISNNGKASVIATRNIVYY